jgi:hypothetical protein
MSLTDSATLIRTLKIDVRSRRSERRLGVLALLAAAVATGLLPLPVLHAMLFFMAVAALIAAGLWRQGWLGGARRLTHISWLSDGSWLLSDTAQANFPATLSRHCRVGSRWLWLRWHMDGADGAQGVRGMRQRSLLLVQGDIGAVELRRLGVRLRLESVSRQPTIHLPVAGA